VGRRRPSDGDIFGCGRQAWPLRFVHRGKRGPVLARAVLATTVAGPGRGL
jgi:hypothetical protein